jgi:hypothetical protein
MTFAFNKQLFDRVLQQLRNLVAMNESLKRQEQQFKAHCKEEMSRLQELTSQQPGDEIGDPEERV